MIITDTSSHDLRRHISRLDDEARRWSPRSFLLTHYFKDNEASLLPHHQAAVNKHAMDLHFAKLDATYANMMASNDVAIEAMRKFFHLDGK
jgi:hypothetical protein